MEYLVLAAVCIGIGIFLHRKYMALKKSIKSNFKKPKNKIVRAERMPDGTLKEVVKNRSRAYAKRG